MKKILQHAIRLAAFTLIALAAHPASAQSAGNWLFKVGINQITPQVKSDDISASALPGSKTDVESDTKPIFSIAYMFTDNLSAELVLGVPYKHNLVGDGSIHGTGKLATAEVLPPTIFLQYRFLQPAARLRPYVGLGLTYAYFQKETGSAALTAITNPGSPRPTTFRLDNNVGISPQIGLTYGFSERWFADLAVTKTYLRTTSHFSTGQTLNVRLDPVAVNLSIGYRF